MSVFRAMSRVSQRSALSLLQTVRWMCCHCLRCYFVNENNRLEALIRLVESDYDSPNNTDYNNNR